MTSGDDIHKEIAGDFDLSAATATQSALNKLRAANTAALGVDYVAALLRSGKAIEITPTE